MLRNTSAISPTVARVLTAARIGGTRLSVPRAACAQRVQRGARLASVATAPYAGETRDLRRFERRIQPVQRRRAGVSCFVGVAVHARRSRARRLDRALVLHGATLDLLLREAGLDRGQHAAAAIDLRDQRGGARLDLRRQRLDGVRAAERDRRRRRRRSRGRGSAACAARGAPTPPSAAPAPRRSRWCAATGRRPARRPAPGSSCARRCSAAARAVSVEPAVCA